MKKLTLAQAALELNEVAKARLNKGPQDELLKIRVAQFTGAVQDAISALQQQVEQLRQSTKS